MENKGPLRVGADADMPLFDPENVVGQSTRQEPAQYPEGIHMGADRLGA
ncbi:MAG: hypothetical protein V1800_17410 [Candidatus Latescibacterota bacterium]